ncbi:DUF945 family protein [Thorsellia anophelis]|uniref:DUF945 domain-containing protein n=1 Tax=Thorsellia anophelis DSM 18579 TaxID=1123402 RepID=A0A1I0E632_9GAMM|nr:DUF945 family protein [Thorsellia anophelis]SET40448.1 protein of unknown function [Thorsellia anophelis DSM 18579]
MTQPAPSNKMKKSLVALGIIAVVGSGAYLGTTWHISKEMDARLGRFVEQTNSKMQENKYLVIKPIITLGEVKSSFFTTEFKLNVGIENIEKLQAQHNLTKMEENVKSDYPIYSDVEIAEAKTAIEKMPDVIDVMAINNIAKHGPIPNISSFNFKPGLMSVSSSTGFTDLSPAITEKLIHEISDTNKDILKNHNYLSGNTFVSFAREFHLQFTSDELSLSQAIPTPAEDDYLEESNEAASPKETLIDINVGKITIDLTAPRDMSTLDLNFDIGKISVVSPQSNLINAQIDGMNLTSVLNRGNVLSGQSNFVVRPIKIETAANPNLTNSISFEGLQVDTNRSINSSGLTANENQNIVLLPITNTSYDTNWFDDSYEIKTFSSSNITLKAIGKDVSTDFYLKYEQLLKKDLNRAREFVVTGDIYGLLGNSNSPGYLLELLDFYRSITGTMDMTLDPFDINSSTKAVFEVGKTPIDRDDFNLKVGTSKIIINRESNEADKPLNFGVNVMSLNIAHHKYDDLAEEDSNISFTLKDTGIQYSVPLSNIYPYSSEYKIGNLSVASSFTPTINLTNLNFGSNLTPSDNTLGYFESYKIENAKFRGLDLGGLDIQAHLTNIDKAGIDLVLTNFKDAFAAYKEAYEKPSESTDSFYMGNGANLGQELALKFSDNGLQIAETILSKGIEFGISPIKLNSEAGMTSLDFNLKLKPITAEILKNIDPDDTTKAYSIIDNMTFNFDADIAYLVDVAARSTLIMQSPGNENIDTAELTSIKEMYNEMANGFISQPPFNTFLTQPSPDKITSQISFKGGNVMINGQEMPLEELLMGVGL